MGRSDGVRNRLWSSRRARARSRVRPVSVVAMLALAPVPVVGQEPGRPAAPIPEQPRPAIDISPRGAFLRALAFPGWGHAAIGAHTRGAFYFGAETAVAYTLVRSRLRLKEAERRLDHRERFLRARADEEGLVDPAEIDGLLDADPAVAELRSLRDARADQQEDMVALGIFVLFLSGADAYVSAHLSRFPAPLEVEAEPSRNGGMELSLRVGLPR